MRFDGPEKAVPAEGYISHINEVRKYNDDSPNYNPVNMKIKVEELLSFSHNVIEIGDTAGIIVHVSREASKYRTQYLLTIHEKTTCNGIDYIRSSRPCSSAKTCTEKVPATALMVSNINLCLLSISLSKN